MLQQTNGRKTNPLDWRLGRQTGYVEMLDLAARSIAHIADKLARRQCTDDV